MHDGLVGFSSWGAINVSEDIDLSRYMKDHDSNGWDELG
jgi:hypothetical protein